MAVFLGRRTRRQLIDQALKKVGNTKIVAEARVELSRMLENLYLQHEWPFLYREATLTMSASVALPDDFLKPDSAPDTALRVTAIDGATDDAPILIVTPQDWRRRAIPRDEQAQVPEIAMIDYAGSTLRPWPLPLSSVTALLVYKSLPAEVDPADASTFDADVPVFPYHGLLTDMLEQWGQEYEHNTGLALDARTRVQAGLAAVLGTALPPDSNRADRIELDPRIFSQPFRANEE